MQELDEPQRALVALARRGLAPTPDDAARVLARVEGALAAGAVHAATDSIVPDALDSLQTGALRWVRKVGLALAIAGASGGIAYRWGFEAGRDDALSSGRVRAPSSYVQAPAGAARADRSPATAITPAVPAAAAAATAPGGPRPRGDKLAAPAVRSAEPGGSSAASLQREVAALRAIERALREGEPGTALELLDALDLELPNGHLREERAAASSMARCALGLGKRRALLEDFSHAHPDSMYLERVQRGCASR